MGKGKELTVEELLNELGYEERDHLYNEGDDMATFMKETDREIRREAQRYIEFIEDCDDDFYLNLKNGKIKRSNEK